MRPPHLRPISFNFMHFLPENRMCAPPFVTKQCPPIWKILDPPLITSGIIFFNTVNITSNRGEITVFGLCMPFPVGAKLLLGIFIMALGVQQLGKEMAHVPKCGTLTYSYLS